MRTATERSALPRRFSRRFSRRPTQDSDEPVRRSLPSNLQIAFVAEFIALEPNFDNIPPPVLSGRSVNSSRRPAAVPVSPGSVSIAALSPGTPLGEVVRGCLPNSREIAPAAAFRAMAPKLENILPPVSSGPFGKPARSLDCVPMSPRPASKIVPNAGHLGRGDGTQALIERQARMCLPPVGFDVRRAFQ